MGIRPVKSWVSVCWWWWFDWSFARLIAVIVSRHQSSLAPIKSRMETFRYWLTKDHLENCGYNGERERERERERVHCQVSSHKWSSMFDLSPFSVYHAPACWAVRSRMTYFEPVLCHDARSSLCGAKMLIVGLWPKKTIPAEHAKYIINPFCDRGEKNLAHGGPPFAHWRTIDKEHFSSLLTCRIKFCCC